MGSSGYPDSCLVDLAIPPTHTLSRHTSPISPYLPAQAWAEGGASFGLCVLLRTKADRLQVTLGGRTLCSVAPPDSAPLRARTWRPMRVHHARPDAGDPHPTPNPTPTPTPTPNPNPTPEPSSTPTPTPTPTPNPNPTLNPNPNQG